VDRLALDPDGIAELVHALLSQAVGGWSMGVQGALAEFAVVAGHPEAVTVQRPARRTIEARTAGGGIRLTVTDETQAFTAGEAGSFAVSRPIMSSPAFNCGETVYLAVPRSTLPSPAAGRTISDTDPEALRAGDRHDLVADLAVGHAAAGFWVRTGDAELGKRLRAMEGAAWPDALAALGRDLVATSPHRIVATPLGRIEVYAPIPTDAGASPEGPHTHLLPPLLRTGRELPAGVDLPPGWAPGAAFHP
jgi:hypothetical protein